MTGEILQLRQLTQLKHNIYKKNSKITIKPKTKCRTINKT